MIFIINLAANIYLLPHTNQIMNNFVNKYVNDKTDFSTKTNIHMRLDSSTYINMESFDIKNNVGYKFNLDNFKGDVLYKKLVADVIKWDSLKRKWELSSYSIRYIDGLNEKMVYGLGQKKDTILDMRPDDFSAYANVYQNIPTFDLIQKVKKERVRGSGVMSDLQFEQYKRFLHPLSAFVLTLIGVALSSRKVRGGVGLPLGIGIFLSFIYIVLNQFAQMFATKGGFSPLLAVIFPSLLFGVLGIYLLYKAPK
ncbi:MAG: YjgP/YjgQ family permease [Pedobacter sp.]|nr:MAG: YjgP/YjgQ family permease [Pedobacter sp.]